MPEAISWRNSLFAASIGPKYLNRLVLGKSLRLIVVVPSSLGLAVKNSALLRLSQTVLYEATILHLDKLLEIQFVMKRLENLICIELWLGCGTLDVPCCSVHNRNKGK